MVLEYLRNVNFVFRLYEAFFIRKQLQINQVKIFDAT